MSDAELARLVRRWDLVMLASANGPLCTPIIERGSVLCPPASREEIEEAERRMGIALPASYRAFLSLSNGARADLDPLHAREEREAVSDPTLCLLPVEEVVPLWERHGDQLADWVVEFYDEQLPHEDSQTVADHRPLMSALLISSLTWETVKYFFCLVPVAAHVDAGREGWEVWDKGWSEITRYVTFASFLAQPIRDSWLQPGPVFRAVNSQLTPDELDLPRHELDSWLDPLQIRRLVAADPSHEVLGFLRSDRVLSHPFTRLAAAQVLAMHGDASRLRSCADEGEPSVALAARATLQLLGATD